MARADITGKLTKGVRNGGAVIELGSLTANTDAYIDFSGNNTRTAVLITASAAGTVTFYHGDAIQGVENGDLEVEVKSGETVLVCIESGVFEITKGENKGLVRVQSSASAKIATFTVA